ARQRPHAGRPREPRAHTRGRPPRRRVVRPRLDRRAGHGCARGRGLRQRPGAAADRAPLRPAGRARRPDARPRRQGDHLRLGRHLAEAAALHAGHEGRHVRRRRRDRGDGRRRRARAAAPDRDRRRRDGERPGRERDAAWRHPHCCERQDDRGDQHRRRGAADPRRRAPSRPDARRDAPRRPRDPDRRDGDRARRPLRRLVLHRRRARGRARASLGRERRPRLALPAAPALPPLRRLRVRRHEERVRAARGRRRACDGVPARVRRRRPVRTLRHRRPGVHPPQAARLRARPGRYRLRGPPPRRARGGARSVNFDLEHEHELLRDTVRQFALEKVAPVAEELDRDKRFPYELVAELAELGLMGMTIPEEYGGGGTDTVSYAIAIEELTRIDSSVAITVAAHHSLGTLPIYYFGSDEQKRQWLPDLASGRRLAAFGLTEPNAGSDAGATRTTARLEGGEWVIDGAKMFITNAGTDITACVTITALTGDGEISNLIV